MKRVKEKHKSGSITEYYISNNSYINGSSKAYIENYEGGNYIMSTYIDSENIGTINSADKFIFNFYSLKEPGKILSELDYKGELSLFRMIKNSPSFKSYYGMDNCLYSKFMYEDLALGVDGYKFGRSYYIENSPSNGIDHTYIDRVLFLLEFGNFLENDKLLNSFGEKKEIIIETEYIDRKNVEEGFEGYIEKTIINKKIEY